MGLCKYHPPVIEWELLLVQWHDCGQTGSLHQGQIPERDLAESCQPLLGQSWSALDQERERSGQHTVIHYKVNMAMG